MMSSLFEFYPYSFLLCLLSGGLLSAVGSHFVIRGESFQVLGLSQAALCGHLLGQLLEGSLAGASLLLSLVFFLGFKFILGLKSIRQETSHLVLYLILLALSYWLISFFPLLESHMALGVFGDIVSLPKEKAQLLVVLTILLLLIFLFAFKALMRRSLSLSLFSQNSVHWKEEVFFALVFLTSLHGVGLLFTITFLLFPTVLAGRLGFNLKKGLGLLALIGMFSAGGGFFLSLSFTRMSTVPTQSLVLFLFLALMALAMGRKKA